MKLSYWICRAIGDSQCYSIRTRTKKEAIERRIEYGINRYEEPKKVTFKYHDGFEMLYECMGEYLGYWEV